MSFLCNNVAAIVVALVASVLPWLYGGMRPDLLAAVAPWLLIMLVEVMICFPQRHHGESTYEARERVWHELKHSPLVLVALILLAVLAIPFFNSGLCEICDAAKIAMGENSAPPISFLPSCVNRGDHLDVFYWFALAFAAAITTRICLNANGQRLVLSLVVWNGVALAVLGFVQEATGAVCPYWIVPADGYVRREFFSSFLYTNTAGDYFVMLFGLAVALWRDHYEYARMEEGALDPSETASSAKIVGGFWRRHYYLLPAAVFFVAALDTLSRAAIMLLTLTASVYFAHTAIIFLARLPKARRVFVGVWSMVIFGVIIFFATVFMPRNIRREVRTLDSVAVLDRMTGKGQYHTRVAFDIWKEHMVFGCGGWGYGHLSPSKLRDGEQVQLAGGINVHNDYLQLLAEHGIVGFGLVVAAVVLLLCPVVVKWRRLSAALRFKKSRQMKVAVHTASAFFIFVAALATMIHAFGDCPLRSSATMVLFFVALSAMPAFMPREIDEDLPSEH